MTFLFALQMQMQPKSVPSTRNLDPSLDIHMQNLFTKVRLKIQQKQTKDLKLVVSQLAVKALGWYDRDYSGQRLKAKSICVKV